MRADIHHGPEQRLHKQASEPPRLAVLSTAKEHSPTLGEGCMINNHPEIMITLGQANGGCHVWRRKPYRRNR